MRIQPARIAGGSLARGLEQGPRALSRDEYNPAHDRLLLLVILLSWVAAIAGLPAILHAMTFVRDLKASWNWTPGALIGHVGSLIGLVMAIWAPFALMRMWRQPGRKRATVLWLCGLATVSLVILRGAAVPIPGVAPGGIGAARYLPFIEFLAFSGLPILAGLAAAFCPSRPRRFRSRRSKVIRLCRDSEFETIFDIINDAAVAYKGIIPADRWHEPYMPREELRQQMAEGVVFWGYEEGGELIGVMGIQHVKDVTLIRHAYVRTKHRQHGIGGKLLAHLRTLTDRPVLIGTWAAATWAIRFYQKHGFRLVTPEEKDRLLRKYWNIPERQVETSVVLADENWFRSQSH